MHDESTSLKRLIFVRHGQKNDENSGDLFFTSIGRR